VKNAWILRALVAAALLTFAAWVMVNTSWVEEDVPDPVKGAAAADRYYSLRPILKAAGSTLETRTRLEPLPPAGATLVLDSPFWDLFPDRDAKLKAWVERGGHLVIATSQLDGAEHLRWVPIVHRRPHPPGRAASGADDDDEDEDDAEAPPARPAPGMPRAAAMPRGGHAEAGCVEDYVEAPRSIPAFEPGRHYTGCLYSSALLPRAGVEPTWQLLDKDSTIALRVPVGRGSVTCVTSWWVPHAAADPSRSGLLLGYRNVLRDDNALVVVAMLDARPGRDVWIVDDEAGEPFMQWLWHHGRAPLLLGLAAVALALWRLMVRFGPREAAPPRARRSMGEQVRGTGEFIAANEPAALHAATRRAFDDAARTRVEDWAALDDPERIDALARRLAPAVAIDRAALLAALNAAPRATSAQWLAAIATIEEARRALLRARPPETRT
jgi:hypothetical protein